MTGSLRRFEKRDGSEAWIRPNAVLAVTALGQDQPGDPVCSALLLAGDRELHVAGSPEEVMRRLAARAVRRGAP